MVSPTKTPEQLTLLPDITSPAPAELATAPVDVAAIDYGAALPPLSQEAPKASTSELARFTAYQGLLNIFGSMNRGENFRNRYEDNPVIVRRVYKPRYGDVDAAYEESVDSKVRMTTEGHDKVRD